MIKMLFLGVPLSFPPKNWVFIQFSNNSTQLELPVFEFFWSFAWVFSMFSLSFEFFWAWVFFEMSKKKPDPIYTVRLAFTFSQTWIHIIHTKFLEIRDQLFIRHDDLNPPLPAEWTNNPYTSVQGRCLIDTLEFKFESAKNSQFKTRCGQFRVFFRLNYLPYPQPQQ